MGPIDVPGKGSLKWYKRRSAVHGGKKPRLGGASAPLLLAGAFDPGSVSAAAQKGEKASHFRYLLLQQTADGTETTLFVPCSLGDNYRMRKGLGTGAFGPANLVLLAAHSQASGRSLPSLTRRWQRPHLPPSPWTGTLRHLPRRKHVPRKIPDHAQSSCAPLLREPVRGAVSFSPELSAAGAASAFLTSRKGIP